MNLTKKDETGVFLRKNGSFLRTITLQGMI